MQKLLSYIISSVVITAFVLLDVSQNSTVSAAILSSTLQKGAGLTLAQLEDLIKHSAPDNAIAIEIRRRGVAFPVSAGELERLKRLGAGPRTIQALQSYIKPQRISPPATAPNKVTILVAEFDGPDPKRYRVTEHIIKRLRRETREYSDISVEALGRAVSEQQGSKVAREIGQQRKARIVVWGWYGPTQDTVSVSVYFEVLRKPKYLNLRENPEPQILPISELNGIKIQTRLSREMTYLTLMTVGLARYEAEDYDGAIKRFTTALDQSNVPNQMIDPAEIYYYRGNAYHYKAGANGIVRAIADYNKAVELGSDSAETYYNRGLAYGKKGQYDRTISDCDEAIKRKSDFAEAYVNRGCAYDEIGQHDRAIADFDKAIALNPDDAIAYNNRGTANGNKGQYDRAIADFDKAIALKPDYANAYYNRGTAYASKGEYDRAISDYDKAIKIKPDYAEAYYNRGLTYASKGEYDRAISDYDKAIKIKPDYAIAYNNRGTVYGNKGQLDQAIADFGKVIELKPDYANAYYNRGFIYASKGEYDRAISDYDKAIKIKPDYAEAYNNRGNAYYRKNMYDPAIADYDKTIEIRPNDTEAYYNRALAYQYKGELDRAIADFKNVLRITNDPNTRQQVQQMLQKLGIK